MPYTIKWDVAYRNSIRNFSNDSDSNKSASIQNYDLYFPTMLELQGGRIFDSDQASSYSRQRPLFSEDATMKMSTEMVTMDGGWYKKAGFSALGIAGDPAYFLGTFDVDSIDEDGASVATFTLTTENVVDGTTIGYTITGIQAEDITPATLTGIITIIGNTGSVSFTAVADGTFDQPENALLTLDTLDSVGTDTRFFIPFDRTYENVSVSAITDAHGFSVASFADRTIVGSPGEYFGAGSTSNARLYNHTGFDPTYAGINTLPSAVTGTKFGYSVGIDATNYIVGEIERFYTVAAAGAVYVYDIATQSELQFLLPPTPILNGNFGRGVAIDGNFAVVGDPYNSPTVSKEGSAYIYSVTTGALLLTLVNPTPTINGYFGQYVAIRGNYVTVTCAAPWFETNSTQHSAYVFNATTGALLWELVQPGGTPVDSRFGMGVSMHGTYAITADHRAASSDGEAYIYDVTTGNLVHTLVNPDTATSSFFGQGGVAISDTWAIIGNDTTVIQSPPGSAYIFDVATGVNKYTIRNPYSFGAAPVGQQHFGYDVAISGIDFSIAAPGFIPPELTGNTGIVGLYTIQIGVDINPNEDSVLINNTSTPVVTAFWGGDIVQDCTLVQANATLIDAAGFSSGAYSAMGIYWRRMLITSTYTAAEVQQLSTTGPSFTITGMRFWVESEPIYQPLPDYAIGLKNTTGAISEDNSGALNGTFTVVLNQSIQTFTAGTFKEFIFDTPFVYTGGNLTVAWAWGQVQPNYEDGGLMPMAFDNVGTMFVDESDDPGVYLVTDPAGFSAGATFGRPVFMLQLDDNATQPVPQRLPYGDPGYITYCETTAAEGPWGPEPPVEPPS